MTWKILKKNEIFVCQRQINIFSWNCTLPANRGIRKNRVKNGRSNFENSRFFYLPNEGKRPGKFMLVLWIWIFLNFFALDFLVQKLLKEQQIITNFFSRSLHCFSTYPPWLYLVMVLFLVLTDFGLTQIIVKARLTFHQHFCLKRKIQIHHCLVPRYLILNQGQ